MAFSRVSVARRFRAQEANGKTYVIVERNHYVDRRDASSKDGPGEMLMKVSFKTESGLSLNPVDDNAWTIVDTGAHLTRIV